jgi:hypothetical protein
MAKRYRLKVATYTVVREDTPLPKKFTNPEASAEFAKEIIKACDD